MATRSSRGTWGSGARCRTSGGTRGWRLSIEAEGRSERGLDHYLVVYGHAEVVEGGAAPLLQRLAEVYLGPGVKFPPVDDPSLGYVMRITAGADRRGRALEGLSPARR